MGCLNCGKEFGGKRRDAKYCSKSCRTGAAIKRKRNKRKFQSRTLNMWQAKDNMMVAERSTIAAENVEKLAAIFGVEAAGLALDAIACLMEIYGDAINEHFETYQTRVTCAVPRRAS